MANTFLTMQNELQSIGPFDTGAATGGRLKLWLNQAQHWFLTKREWSFLESRTTFATVSGQADYVLLGTSPVVTDFASFISVTHNQANAGTTFVKLREMQQQDFDDVFSAAGATPGIPLFYTIRGGTATTTSATTLSGGNQIMSVWPVMNFIGSAKLGYVRSVASCEMTADTDLCIIPVQYQPAVIWKAASIGLNSRGALAQGAALGQAAEEVLAEAVAFDTPARMSDLPAGIRPEAPAQLPPLPGSANLQQSPYGVAIR